MDMTAAIAPKSDQLNADDFITGPRTFTIQEVKEGSSEQPVNVHLVDVKGKVYRPSKSMARVMVGVWGKEAAEYAGHRLTLFRNPNTKFGSAVLGGIEISHVSHIDKPVTLHLTSTRGRKQPFTVQPLIEVAPQPSRDWLAEAEGMNGDPSKLRPHWTEARDNGADQETLDKIHQLAAPVAEN